jgi:beta-glucosidase
MALIGHLHPWLALPTTHGGGSIMEGSGEDPFLGSVIAAARVRGFQGKDLSDRNTIVACAKHFAGYRFAEAGRDYNTVDMSEQ